MSSEPAAKRARTSHPEYHLLYHGGIPGRGEFIRLAFEATGTPYVDIGNVKPARTKEIYATCAPTSLGTDGNPPPFCPPMLRVPGAGKNGGDLVIWQTSNILLYLGRRLGLVGDADEDEYFVNGLALTALDMNNEVHDTHHPIAPMKYYEEQKDEALKKAIDFREHRVPKFLGYFNRVLKGNEKNGKGVFLVGNKLTYADLCLWQVLDGTIFAFPKEFAARKESGEYSLVLETFYEGIKELDGIKAYLGSERRLKYSHGVFRHYPELDRE
jgi:glutathione S-transferase